MTRPADKSAKRALIPGNWWPTLALLGCALLGYYVLPTLGVGKNTLVGNPAPPFSLPVVHGGNPGNRIQLEDYRGKVVVLDFWATWCRPCRAQMPIIDAFAREHGPGEVAVIGISTDESPQIVTGFLRGTDIGYPIVHDDARVFARYGGVGLPTLVVIAPNGTVIAVRAGVTGRAALEELWKQASTARSSFDPTRFEWTRFERTRPDPSTGVIGTE